MFSQILGHFYNFIIFRIVKICQKNKLGGTRVISCLLLDSPMFIYMLHNGSGIFNLQEAFESKQATMFLAIDKLFALHNAILLESRLIKAFIVYSIAIFIIYMFTSTKQTYTVRSRLYMGMIFII